MLDGCTKHEGSFSGTGLWKKVSTESAMQNRGIGCPYVKMRSNIAPFNLTCLPNSSHIRESRLGTILLTLQAWLKTAACSMLFETHHDQLGNNVCTPDTKIENGKKHESSVVKADLLIGLASNQAR